jgi:hypothetical protein
MFKQECGATMEQLIKETRKTSDAMTTMKNIFFWSKEQLNLKNATKKTKVIALASEFGTGKTILLKEKAKEIIQEYKRKNYKERRNEAGNSNQERKIVVFVIFEGEAADCILKQQYADQFQETCASVHGIPGSKGIINCVFYMIFIFNYG